MIRGIPAHQKRALVGTDIDQKISVVGGEEPVRYSKATGILKGHQRRHSLILKRIADGQNFFSLGSKLCAEKDIGIRSGCANRQHKPGGPVVSDAKTHNGEWL